MAGWDWDAIRQIVALVMLVGGAGVWRTHVERLQATIASKDAEIKLVERQRFDLEKKSPESIEKALSDRIEISHKEIERLSQDKAKNEEALRLAEEGQGILERTLEKTRGFRKMLELEEEDLGDLEGLTDLEVVRLGEVGVDSGQLMITDPCYIDSEWKQEEHTGEHREGDHGPGVLFPYSYDGACRATTNGSHGQLAYSTGHAGAGVAFTTYMGDGIYPVYGERHDGRMVRVYINVV